MDENFSSLMKTVNPHAYKKFKKNKIKNLSTKHEENYNKEHHNQIS